MLHLRSNFLSNLVVYFFSSSTVLLRPRRELSGSHSKGCIKVLGRFSFVIEMYDLPQFLIVTLFNIYRNYRSLANNSH